MTRRLHLSFACGDYDRVRALQDGRVRPEGIDLTFLPLGVEETFYRQLRHREFDISELSLSSYAMTLDQDDPPFVALPVFPSRFFRHQSIYVNARSGIEQPADLVGKRVGTPEYQMTAGVWQRGILAEEYGVPVESVHYFTGGIEQPGRPEKLPLDLPATVKITAIGPGQTLSQMLADGELDAIYSASQPSCMGRDPHIRHLFEDFPAVERDYYARTGIFPIMHVVAVRGTLVERHPWIARSLTKAFEESLRIAYDDLRYRSALKVMLPWLQQHVTATAEALGEGWWDYGLEKNRTTLETFARYQHEQHLVSRRRTAEELVAASASDTFVL
ncbi:4,5-dihydroxyphthalate decarboxylase [Streptomyces antioxidans]|uniref:4,5-dihydroxyphthalate decarboxylase n=1 Tax=Streptomyces antioxidans TaxID=1507734 RepID=A0A1V4DCD6_9ACTN|nr:4,5-dihydroxyphthalate decarboxylase [Streptomyces antioxidans]OPF83864.1 4,5-dihydroxyphthalate decarboxylase [Streptomyces antioxidans]